MTKKQKYWTGGIAGFLVLFMIGGYIYNSMPPDCSGGPNISSNIKVDERLAELGYKIIRSLPGKNGCFYRLATTPLNLRAVIIFDAATEDIVISKWDYLEK